MDYDIFCPICQSFIGDREKCGRCHWTREARADLIGQIKWTAQLSTVDPIPGAPPFPARISSLGDSVFIPMEIGSIAALDADTGEIRWQRDIQPDGKRRVQSAPVWKNVLLVSPEHLLDLPDPNCSLMAWDIRNGETLWTWEIAGDSLSTPLVDGDTAYLVSSDQRLYAYDLANRKVRWSAQTFAWSPDQPACSGETIVVPSRGPTTAAYQVDSGRRIWAFEAEDPETEMLHNRPAISDDTVYLSGWGKRVYALDLQTGRPRWTFTAERGVTSAPVLAGDVLLIGVKDYRSTNGERKSGYGLYALDTQTGRTVWKFQTDKHVYTLPVVAGRVVLFGGDDRRLHMLDRDTGEEIWQAAFTEKVRTGPFLYGSHVIAGLLDHTLVSMLWKVEQPVPGDPDALLAEGRPLEAAAALALSGRYEYAARLYAEHGEPLHAAWLYVEAGLTAQAAEIFTDLGELDIALDLRRQHGDRAGEAAVLTRMGKTAEAAVAFEESGQLDEAVASYIQSDRAGYAAMLLWKAGRRKEAADLFSSINQDDQAAEALAEDKRYAEAAEVYQRIGKQEVAAGVLAQGGLLAKAAAINEEIGRLKLAAEQYTQCGQVEQAIRLYETLNDWNSVISLAEKTGDVLRLANALQQTGQLERAAQEYERAGEYKEALNLYQTQSKWERAAAMALKLNDYRQQAFALSQMGLMIQAGEAYEHAAENLYEQHPQASEGLAELYEAAAKCYAEDDDFLRYGSCWDKVCQYRGWPYLKGQFEIESNFVQGEASLVTLIVKNAGYSPAQNIRVQAISQKFRLDETDSEINIRLLGVQQDKPMQLLLMPQENFLGHVRLWVLLAFKDLTGRDHEVKVEQTVKVQERGLQPPAGLFEEMDLGGWVSEAVVKIWQGLVEYFDEDELRSLCFVLLVDFETLSGENKQAKARELIRYLVRRGRLKDLTDKCKELRPNAVW